MCWSVLLVLAGFHNALILEPMTIVGPAEYGERLNGYLRSNDRLNWFVMLLLAAITILVAFAYRREGVRAPLLVLAACLPGYLLLLVARRKQYVLNLPGHALRVSLLYALVVFGIVGAAKASGRLSVIWAVAAIGIGGGVGLTGLSRGSKLRDGDVSLAAIARDHWRYGKWLFASALLAMGTPDVQTILLSMLVDLKSAGALRALMNFVLPLSQLITILSIYALPRLAERAKQWGAHQLLKRGILFPAAMTGLIALYLGTMTLFAPQLERVLYGRQDAELRAMGSTAVGIGICCGSGRLLLYPAARRAELAAPVHRGGHRQRCRNRMRFLSSAPDGHCGSALEHAGGKFVQYADDRWLLLVAFEEHAQDGSFVTLSVFDPNITENSPAGSCLLEMLRAAEGSYELCVFTSKTDLAASERVVIHKIPTPNRPVFLQNMVFTVLASLLYLIRGQKQSLKISTQGAFPFCEIAYAHNPHKLFLTRYRQQISGGWLTRTARLVNYRWIALMESIAFKQARIIVVPSRGLADQLTEIYGEAVAAKLRVIPNPVDCKAFAGGVKPAVPRPFTFAFCALGNFEWKGLRLVIEALASGISADLKVIGGNESEIRRFSKVAQAAGVADQVSFVGLQGDIRPHLWSSDVFVFPSLHESFGLACLQAAAAGLPLIITELYALDQLLQPGVSGWKVERTAESVRQAMEAALADRERTAQMGCNAQLLAQEYECCAFCGELGWADGRGRRVWLADGGQHFLGVPFHFHLRKYFLDLARRVDDEGGPFDSHVLLAVHAFFFPDAVESSATLCSKSASSVNGRSNFSLNLAWALCRYPVKRRQSPCSLL